MTHQHYRTVHALAAGRCKVDSTLTVLKGWVHRRCTTLGSRRGGHDKDELRGAHLRARSVWQWCAWPICIAHSRTQGGVRVRLILRPLPLNRRFINLAESPAARILFALNLHALASPCHLAPVGEVTPPSSGPTGTARGRPGQDSKRRPAAGQWSSTLPFDHCLS